MLNKVICGVIAYVVLIFILRISGKRTLSKWNAFDLVVTIAFGSIIATILLAKDVSLAEGIVALALLVALQFAVTWLSVRWLWFSRLVKAQPSLLIRNGELLRPAMRAQRVTEGEVCAALRSHGICFFEEVATLILETDGSFSVLRANAAGRSATTLGDVENGPDAKDPMFKKRAGLTTACHPG